MRYLVLAFLSVTAMGVPSVPQVEYSFDTAAGTLATTFPGAAQLSGFSQIYALTIANNSNQTIEVNCTSQAVPTACNSGLCKSLHVPAGAVVSTPDNTSLSSSCWLRANTVSPTTGVIYLQGYGW